MAGTITYSDSYVIIVGNNVVGAWYGRHIGKLHMFTIAYDSHGVIMTPTQMLLAPADQLSSFESFGSEYLGFGLDAGTIQRMIAECMREN